ncbi:uveal autoantigen with coiled-coil domains and ankyrin repeats protein isoform X2 [Amia ocellicauda]|uniref:uveal autoantigen with coiled-coil domains and ankyrin repeats protein isoform X2 n=1 Tax=Amia ocellicauda TaxID=2972642 RepID=UPI003464C275
MSRWLTCASLYFNTDWNKHDDRLMKAVERGEVDKVATALTKKGIIPTKLDVEGRSAFHLAATRGHLDCLNLILGHNVDITATDATGKNALHLAARNGQSLCVQKLLQHNCPVGNVDLQGRTALHDAVMAGCASSVKLLCDSGSSVNAKDFDGRTPLVLATQMCHPKICQLLLERGADISIRDKQNKTALMLGCEYSCREAVEVLLQSGADVTAKDVFDHDSYHYARLGKDPQLVAVVRAALDNATRAKEAAKVEHKHIQSMEKKKNAEAEASIRDQFIEELQVENNELKDKLRKFHQEQRILLDRVSGLQQQLNQEKKTVEELQKEREQLKLQLAAKDQEKDESVRAMETVKVQLKSHLGDYSGQSVIKGKDNVLTKQSYSLDSAQILQAAPPSRSVSRSLEVSRPYQASGGETEMLRRMQEKLEEEVSRLQAQLVSKEQECLELQESCDAARRDADRQVCDMEQALSDVQKRMVDSESKVKLLQAHVVAVKEHLNSQQLEELRGQLQDVKAKYEGASAEVGRVRNHLKQSEKALEEYKQSEGRLAEEVDRLTRELNKSREEREDAAGRLMELEGLMKEVEDKLVTAVPAEKFDNMKNLLTNALDEKEKQMAELREDYERALEDAAELQRELEEQKAEVERRVLKEEHQRVRAVLEEQTASLKGKLAEVTAKSQALIKEVEQSQQDSALLREQLKELNRKMQEQHVPLKTHLEVKESLGRGMEELNQKLAQAEWKSSEMGAELQKLQVEKVSLCENVTHLQAQYVSPERFKEEVHSLEARNVGLKQELQELQKKSRETEERLAEVTSENSALRKSLQEEYVPQERYEESRMQLSVELERANGEFSRLAEKCRESEEELKKVKEGNVKLEEKLQDVETNLEKEYISLEKHEAIRNSLNNTVSDLEFRVKEATEKYESMKGETIRLHKEIEAQKKELDMIQAAIQSRFVPLSVIEEKENSFNAKLKELTGQLAEVQQRYSQVKAEGEQYKQEKEKLKVEVASVQRSVESGYVSSVKYQEVEDAYKGKVQVLMQQLADLEQQYRDVTLQRKQLEEQNAQCNMEMQSLQNRMDTECVRIEQFEAVKQSLSSSLQQAQEECQRVREACRSQTEKVSVLERELQSRSAETVLLAEHVRVKEGLEREVSRLREALREEEERSVNRAEEVGSLQMELLSASRAAEEAQGRESGQAQELRTEKQRLEAEVLILGQRLSNLGEGYEELTREASRAREGERRAQSESETLQARSLTVQSEITELKERYDKSLATIGDLQRRIQASSGQTEAKDKKISELLAEVERLKQALNSLAIRSYGPQPSKRGEALQAQVKSLQQQLADAERRHREVVSTYRTHLLSAAQGHMDEDVQAALLQIIRMRQEFVC